MKIDVDAEDSSVGQGQSCVVYVGVGNESCVIEQVAGQAAVWCGMLVLNSRIVLMYEQ